MTLGLSLNSPSFEVADRIVVITGAGNGIGAETARQLVARGASVALLDRDEAAVKRLADELGGAAEGIAVDVTDTDGVDAAITAVVRRFGRIDAVVANAGIAGPWSTIDTMDDASFEQVIDINVLGVWRTVRAALPHVRAQNGYVLVVASIAAAFTIPTAGAYSASKAAVEGFGRALRMELDGTGTRVGVAYFGAIDTGMVREITTGTGLQAVLDSLPKFLGRPAPVADAARVIVNGIERRSNRVYAPRWVAVLLALRTPIALADPLVVRLPKVRAAIQHASRPRQIGNDPAGKGDSHANTP
jgi:NAD(P)-dependent dehydrogenase (short-subunit alcohol dehydrogenase family)